MNSFAVVIADQRKGDLVKELSQDFAKLVEAVRGNQRAGSITLKITLTPTEGSDGATVLMEDDIVLRLPKAKKGRSLFYTQEGGLLTRNDPNQSELPLQSVPLEQPADLRKVQ